MIIRLMASTPAGFLITGALILTMHMLIEVAPNAATPNNRLDIPVWWVTSAVESPPVDNRPLPKRPNAPQQPPALESPAAGGDGLVGPAVGLPPQQPASLYGHRLDFHPFAEGPMVQIVAGQPAYPERARQRGLEGFVTVSFSVSQHGTTDNVRVIESSHPLFEAAAVRAAALFRFKPQVIDGRPQRSHGVTYRFRFELDE